MTVFIALCALLVGYFFGKAEANACQQRALSAEAEVERLRQLVHAPDERTPTTVSWGDNFGGMAK